MKNTYEGFVLAVKQQYEVSKNGIYASFLLNPSPAQLRNFCLLLLENKLNKADEEIFRVFFQVREGELLRKSIENFDVEKFKAIKNFLIGKSESTNAVSLNLIAILVDYQPRPFNKYLNTNSLSIAEPNTVNTNDFQENKTIVLEPLMASTKDDNSDRNISLKKLFGIGLLVLFVLGFVYIYKNEFYSKKECMQWQNDHYEMVDCSVRQQGIVATNDIIPLNETEVNLKKIKVNEKTIFFKNGKPLVWYSKTNGKLDYYNSHGMNPETGKPLKPITGYMINKYVLKLDVQK